MLIECTVQRDEPVVVAIGNEKYEFRENEQGRKVAEVWLEAHVRSFLAVRELYRPYEDEPQEAEPVPVPPRRGQQAPAVKVVEPAVAQPGPAPVQEITREEAAEIFPEKAEPALPPGYAAFDHDGDGQPDPVFDHDGDGAPGGSLPKAKRGKGKGKKAR